MTGVLAALTRAEADAVWDAIAQYVENGIDARESGSEMSVRDEARIDAAIAVLARLDDALASGADVNPTMELR